MQLRRLAVAVLAAGRSLACSRHARWCRHLSAQRPDAAARRSLPAWCSGARPLVPSSSTPAHGSTTARIASGAPFTIKVCGWIPGTGVAVSVQPPSGSTRTIDTVPADGDGDSDRRPAATRRRPVLPLHLPGPARQRPGSGRRRRRHPRTLSHRGRAEEHPGRDHDGACCRHPAADRKRQRRSLDRDLGRRAAPARCAPAARRARPSASCPRDRAAAPELSTP